jgi:hypothetical protein
MSFNGKKTLFTSRLDLNFKMKLVKCYIWRIALYGAVPWILQKLDQKYTESFEKWCWREVSCPDHVRNGEVLQRVKEEWDIIQTLKEGRLTGLIISRAGTAL